MNEAVIALGSNIQPRENIASALKELEEAFPVIKKSNFNFTKPVGYKDQPDFLNGSVLIQTDRQQAAISTQLKQIEQQLGRERSGHPDGPRKIDLDLILYNNEVIDKDVFKRDFLQKALNELLPGLKLDQ